MSNRTSMYRKKCVVCERIRHRDEMMLVPFQKTRIVESDAHSGWVCFFCVEDLRKAEAMACERFKAWQARRAA